MAVEGSPVSGPSELWSITSGRSPVLQPRRREPDAAAVFHQLQPEEGLVHQPLADHYRGLGGIGRQPLGSPVGGGIGRIMKFGNQPVNLTACVLGILLTIAA